MPRIVDVERVVVEGRQRADHAHHRRHRMRVPPEPGVEVQNLLVQHRVLGHHADELVLFLLRRQLAIEQQEANLEET